MFLNVSCSRTQLGTGVVRTEPSASRSTVSTLPLGFCVQLEIALSSVTMPNLRMGVFTFRTEFLDFDIL